MEIYLAIPAFNEEATIKKLIEDASGYVGNIVVINDSSTDDTEKILKSFPKITYLKNENNIGYVKSLEKAINKAFKLGADYVITLDADGQHQVSNLKNFISAIRENEPDLVLGKRSFKNRFMEDVFGWYSKLRFGFSDPLCGMKAYQITIYKRYGCLEKRYTIATELTFRAVKDKASFIEVPIISRKRQSQPRFANNLMGNFLELRALINVLFL